MNALTHTLPATLQQARKARRLSQLELSLRMGVSQRHVSFVESGRSRPSRDLLLTWLQELDAPLALRNAALLQAPDALWNALAQRQWLLLFTELRPLWSQARLVLFGHALLEKLATPRKSITAHVLRVDPSAGAEPARWDAWLADVLDPGMLADRPFVPLPVLGVPGWWPANENPHFYMDALVFRPAAAPRRMRQ